MKISASGYVVLVIIAGFLLIGYLFAASPDSAPQQLPLILAMVGGIVTLLLKQGDTDAQVAKAKEAAIASIGASEQNATVLEAVNKKVAVVQDDMATNTAITAEANKQIRELTINVDGRLSKLLEQTAIAARLTGAQEERDRPTDAPSGSTPAHGTPIGGTPAEGATVITIDPPEAATITSVPPKGKRPKVGDQQ